MRKVLIVSHNSLSLHANNGKTLTSMFRDWDSESLAQLFFQEEIPESDKFVNFFRVRDLDILKRIFSLGFLGAAGNVVHPKVRVVSHYESAGWVKARIVKALRRTDSLKLVLRDLLYGTGLWKSRELLDWVRGFSPDSIFFVGGNSRFSFLITLFISRKLGVPVDIFITDDYVLNAQPNGLLAKLMHKRLVEIYRDAFSVARNVFVIGDDMACEFSREYRRTFLPVMNAVDMPGEVPGAGHKKDVGCGDLDVVYAGGLHLGRGGSIVEFGELTRKVGSLLGLNITLTVYSTSELDGALRSGFERAGVLFGGGLTQGELQSRLMAADFVLHVESFDERNIRLTKLSVSTKLPEYLSSGACLIGFGPSALASIRLIDKNGVGVVVTELDDEAARLRKLADLFGSPELASSLAARGFDFAKDKFDAKKVRNFVSEVINCH